VVWPDDAFVRCSKFSSVSWTMCVFRVVNSVESDDDEDEEEAKARLVACLENDVATSRIQNTLDNIRKRVVGVILR